MLKYISTLQNEANTPQAEIHRIFEDRYSILRNRKLQAIDKLIQWGADAIRMIQEHVDEQKRLIEENFNHQIYLLDGKYRLYNNEATFLAENNDLDRLQQVLAECRTLKFQALTVFGCDKVIPFMEVHTEDYPPKKNEEKQGQNRSSNDNDNNSREIVDSQFSRRTVAPRSTTEAQSTINDNSFKSGVKDTDDIVEECPICFMLFSTYQSATDRHMHVNSHYEDD